MDTIASTNTSGESSTSIENNESLNPNSSVVVCRDLSNLIHSVKKLDSITTYGEVMEGLRDYISHKQLFDPFYPVNIHCKDDKLSRLFGVTDFTILDVKNLLEKFVFPVLINSNADFVSSYLKSCDITQNEESGKNHEIKQCIHMPALHPLSPMVLEIPKSPKNEYDSSSEGVDSSQGYETSYVKDSSDDDTWFYETSRNTFMPGETFLAIEETYNLEYELNSDSSNECANFLSDIDSDSSSDFYTATITEFICKTDSDVDCWADKSSDDDLEFDAEISESDQWKCNRCGDFNKPPMRFCLRCWTKRTGWVLSNKATKKPPRVKLKTRNRNKKKLKRELSFTEREELSKFQNIVESLSQESFDSHCSAEGFSSPKSCSFIMCILCCSKPANACLIHGKYAHQISCYECARKLQQYNKRCPICRRTIDKVVKNISVN